MFENLDRFQEGLDGIAGRQRWRVMRIVTDGDSQHLVSGATNKRKRGNTVTTACAKTSCQASATTCRCKSCHSKQVVIPRLSHSFIYPPPPVFRQNFSALLPPPPSARIFCRPLSISCLTSQSSSQLLVQKNRIQHVTKHQSQP